MELTYKNWLRLHSNKPEGSPEIKEYEERPAYYLSPEDIAAYVNAVSPYELFTNPDVMPFRMDYPTTAINYNAPWYLPEREKNVTALFPNKASMKYGLTTDWMDMLQDPLLAQAVYEHEVGHQKDPRTNPYKMWSFPNKGLLTWQGLFGELLQREFPAMVAEENFRDRNRQ